MRLTILLALLGVMYGLGHLAPGETDALLHQSTVAFGFMILAGVFFGDYAQRFGMPAITGYILAGLFCGPDLLGLLSPAVVQHLSLFDTLALFLISMEAGGELDRQAIRRQFSLLMAGTLLQLVVGLAVMTPVLWALSRWIPFFGGLSHAGVWALALMLGVISVAKSPIGTIAVIIETGARGPVRDFILGVTILMDVAVILVFALLASFCVPLISGVESHSHFLLDLLHIGLSLLLGAGIGGLFIVYIRQVGKQLHLAILAVAILMVNVCATFHLEAMLLAIAAGYVISNHSDHGREFIHHLEQVSLPVFVVFFGIAGASVQLGGLGRIWPLALFFVLLRGVAKWFSTELAARWTHAGRLVARQGWKGFIGQAGLTLGLATLLADAVPVLGSQIRDLFLAAVLVNLLVGPVLLRQGLVAAGEVPGMRQRRTGPRVGEPAFGTGELQ
ncbi:MAG: cation:proton antiporter [Candidatus Cloacimonetes bacterium]|nr:cation:proton antiporter [Candidatus Cloacimonadota bacterium]